MLLVKTILQPRWDLADHYRCCSLRCVVIDAKGSSKAALLWAFPKKR